MQAVTDISDIRRTVSLNIGPAWLALMDDGDYQLRPMSVGMPDFMNLLRKLTLETIDVSYNSIFLNRFCNMLRHKEETALGGFCIKTYADTSKEDTNQVIVPRMVFTHDEMHNTILVPEKYIWEVSSMTAYSDGDARFDIVFYSSPDWLRDCAGIPVPPLVKKLRFTCKTKRSGGIFDMLYEGDKAAWVG